MKKYFFLIGILLSITTTKALAQTPVNMSLQNGLTYDENFNNIANWTFNTSPTNGTLTGGVGANHWKGIDVATTTPAIPNGARVTHLSNFFQTQSSSGGVPIYSSGIYKGNQSLIMLTTGATDNTSAIAFDLYLDFTNVNAGTLSFDWNSLNNNSGNRKGSLRVYATTDGVNYTEITAAQVLNFTNFSPTSGSIINAALPSNFNGSATARLRFYYHNGVGGTSGSRPRINIDNVKVTATSTTPCTAPIAQPTAFSLGTVLYNTINFSFTAASPAPQNYLVVISKNNSLSSYPTNGSVYNIGDNVGDGTVATITNTTNVSITGLTNSTTYYIYVFAMNNVCQGGPLYYSNNPLTGSATTLAGLLPCSSSINQPTNLIFSNATTTSISGSFTASSNADEYIVVRTTAANFTGTLNNGTTYNGGNFLGNGTIVTRTSGNTFTANSLISGTTYYFWVFAVNSKNCNNGPAYNTISPLTANIATVSLPACNAPTAQPTLLQLTASNAYVNGYFVASNSADGYLVLRSLNNSLSILPTNGTNYAIGSNLGTATVVANGSATSFIDNNLVANTTYYYFVLAKNSNCIGTTPVYLTTTPLMASASTTTTATQNFYFGNLHAHSSYSDGNVDNTALIPSDDYAYAKNSLCMDFLGISEHNHLMNVSNWQPGLAQATAATTANFLALYGMEYGVISNGGHVLIYGSDQLIGWTTNNYNIFVAQSDYTGTAETTGSTGLFRTINNMNNAGNVVFTSLAHPDFSDYNNIANTVLNATADSAISGCAVASGPAFSQNTSYSDPPSAMGYLDYFNRLLSIGYHIAPFMDHDNHYTTFGRTNNNRLAVLSPTLNKNDFLTAVKNRKCYASEDCDTRIIFTLNNNDMGSITTGNTTPAMSVYAYDPTSPTAVPTIKLMYGIAGSLVTANAITTSNDNSLNYNDNNIPNNTQVYYYADIIINGKRTITAPIWYTKTSAVPVKWISFTAQLNRNRTVLLQWQTTNEINNKEFIVERSADGINYKPINIVAANIINKYSLIDEQPIEAINYYRLKQIDNDGKYSYSSIASVSLKSSNNNSFNIVQNPVQQQLQLKLNAANAGNAQLIITNILGKTVATKTLNLVKGFQNVFANTNELASGNYFVSIIFNNEIVSDRFIK